MSAYAIVLLCNALLFGVVLFFYKAELFKKFGNHRILDIVALGVVCFGFYLFCFLNATSFGEWEVTQQKKASYWSPCLRRFHGCCCTPKW